MVQLLPVKSSDVTALSESMEEKDGSPSAGSPRALTDLQLALNPSATAYHGYETYIEDGLICLRHKIRNIEKKKLKLEGYQMKLKNGEPLNRDQMDAVGRYEEVVHNMTFARELEKTLSALTQDLLKVQRKAMRREQVQMAEEEQRRLSMMLQVQYVLCNLQRQDVRKTFSTRECAHYLSAQEVEKLMKLASLLACKRDESISLERQMEQASFVYLDLLTGKDEPVAGSTYKCLKEKLLSLVGSGLFDRIPEPEKHTEKDRKQTPDASSTPLPAGVNLMSVNRTSLQFLNRRYINGGDPTGPSAGQGKNAKVHSPTWKTEFLALKEQEPPDSWDMESTDPPASSEKVFQKPWKGAAGFIPKSMVTLKSADESKQKRQKKVKRSQASKSNGEVKKAGPVEVFNSPSSLAKDPTLRRQQLDHLMAQITGSFSFIQDSLLDGEATPANGRSRALCLSPGSAPLAQKEQKILPADLLPQSQHSTPIHGHQRPGETQSPLINGDQITNASDLKLRTEDRHANQDKGYTSPPLYCREPCISVPRENENSKQTEKQPLSNGDLSPNVLLQTFSTPPSRRPLPATSTAAFSSLHSVFSGEVPMTRSSEPKIDESGFLGSVCMSYTTASPPSYCTASTQTPPELSLLQDDLQMESAYLSESDISATSQVYSSPGLNSAPQTSLVQHYYPRSTLRGMTRGARGLSHASLRSPGASRGGYEVHRVNVRGLGGGYSAQTHRESGSVLYTPQENGYQQSHKRTGGTAARRNSSVAAWSDSSQVSSPDREGTYIIDSAHGDSLSVTGSGMPITGPPPHTLMPMYPQIRVAFSAARATNLAPGTLDQPIAFDLLHSNLGGAFDAPSGHFSCPAAGMYVFFFHILKLAISVPLYVNLMRNDEVVASAYANDGAPDHETASNHALLPLRVGDHIWLRLHRGAIYGSTWKYSTFSGFLLYPD